jgi:organic radical activating enzyme
MNLKEAIKALKRHGYKILLDTEGKYHLDRYEENYGMTAREVVRLGRCYSSEYKGNTAVKRNVKEDDHKDRYATKKEIRNENFDRIPLRGKVKPADIWDWD